MDAINKQWRKNNDSKLNLCYLEQKCHNLAFSLRLRHFYL